MGRSLHFQQLCIAAMVLVALFITLMRAPMFNLAEQSAQLEREYREFWNNESLNPANKRDRDGSIILNNSSGRKLQILNRKDWEFQGQMKLWESCIRRGQVLLALLYFPLIISVFWPTGASGVTPRIYWLSVMLVVVSFVLAMVDDVFSQLERLIPHQQLFIPAYPYLILFAIPVVWSSKRSCAGRRSLIFLGVVPVILLGLYYLQDQLPYAWKVQYGFWIGSMLLAIACTWLSIRAELQFKGVRNEGTIPGSIQPSQFVSTNGTDSVSGESASER